MVDSRRRVLYVQPNNEIGGSDIALLRTITVLDQTRFAPAVALPCDGPMSDKLRDAGAELHFLPMAQLRTVPALGYQSRYLAAFIPTVRRLAALIRDQRFDLVHTNSLYCLYGPWAARVAGCPHVWHVREIPPNVPVARQAYAAMVLGLSRLVISMGTPIRDGLFGAGNIPAKSVIMPDGIDIAQWHPGISGSRIRSALSIADKAPVIGFVARLDPWKGLEVFLRAAQQVVARVPDAQFIVSGDAPPGFEAYRDEMMRLATTLGIAGQVHFLGWRYRLDDIPEVMAAFDVMCHTPVRPEPFGMVVLEAMAVGRPVVASRAGGPTDFIIDGESGYLAPTGDSAAFAERIIDLLACSTLRHRIGTAAAVRIFDHYSYANWGARLSEIYDRALA